METPSIDESVHVISGDSAAGSLRQAGGGDTIVLHDTRSPGPCDVNPHRHRRKRQTFLRGYIELFRQRDRRKYAAHLEMLTHGVVNAYDLADRLSSSPEKPVCIWTSPSWHDRLALWWVLDAVKRTRLGLERFWVAEPAVEAWQQREEMAGDSLGTYLPRCFADATANVCRLDADLLSTGASPWRAFAGRSPVDFDRACRECRYFPDLRWTAKPYAMLIPRIIGQRLIVSELDQLILDGLCADAWLRPVDLLRTNFQLIDLFNCFGDLFFVRRLREWAGTPAVLMQEEAGGVSEFTAVSFRLTEMGERLREQGMHSSREAPELWIGGCRLYGYGPCWIRRRQGKGWRFEQIQA